MIKRKLLPAGLLLLILLATAAFVSVRPDRPPRTDLHAPLFQGVTYTRLVRTEPRPLMIHVVEIDMAAPGLGLLVTPPDSASGAELVARTTGEFLDEFGVQVAINGGFFEPAPAAAAGLLGSLGREALDVWGLAISNGRAYSDDHRFASVFCAGDGILIQRGDCAPGTRQALSGSPLLVVDGQRADRYIRAYRTALHPRTAVAVDATGRRLWFIVVDGRQRGYSEGMTLYELADLALDLGAQTALNLDGGGSTTLVVDGPDGPRTLNSPIHGRIPMRQRPVANHLGLYALPLER